MPKPSSDVVAARALVARERHGVLSTAHADFGGWPFGSIVPYARTAEGDLVFLLSDIAEHTKNLAADPRASLLVADPAASGNPQAGARVTLLGRCSVPAGAAGKAAADAYFERFPEAKAHLSAHGFSPHVLKIDRVRWIAGFGSMGWLDRDGWSAPAGAAPEAHAAAPGPSGRASGAADPLAKHAPATLEHVNRDHAQALVDLARRHARAACTSARMTSIDSKGCVLEVAPAGRGKAKPTSVRVDFPAPAPTPDAARKALISLIADARRAQA